MWRSTHVAWKPLTAFLAALAAVCLVVATNLPGQESPPAERRLPTAALINLDRSPAAALLEAQLLAGERATWVERAEIDRLLKEQELASAFGAQGGKDRLALGKLLKADVLVLVRSVQSTENVARPAIECVICETGQGLRLQVASVPVEGRAEAAAAALEKIVERGLQKHAQKITEIVAVPPLLSDDLGFEHNYLQSAFAKCLEQVLLETPGLVVVELAEAQAIAEEVALAAASDTVTRRQLPLYVLGRFRHYSTSGEPTVAIRVRLARGEQELARRERRDLTDALAPGWLRQQAAEFMAAARLAPALAEESPEVDARQLAARAAEFHRVGNWEESLALIEASLLLSPDQEQLHHDAVVALERLTRRHWRHAPLPKGEVARGLAYYVRGLAHLEAYLTTAGPFTGPDAASRRRFTFEFDSAANGLNIHPAMKADAREVVEQVRQLRTQTYIRIAGMRAARGFGEEGWIVTAWNGIQDQQQQYAMLEKAIEALQDAPDIEKRLDRLSMLFSPAERKTAAHLAFLARLEKMPIEEVRKYAQRMQPGTAAAPAALPAPAPRPAAPAAAKDVDFSLVQIQLENPLSGSQNDFVARRWFPVGGGRDLFWGNGLYLMERPGWVRRLWKLQEPNVRLTSVVFDGRLVWATAQRLRRPAALVAVDLATDEVFEFTDEDGLPLGPEGGLPGARLPERIVAAPVSPGRVCLAGYLGRSWIGVASVSPEGQKSVDVFHEARVAEDSGDSSQAEMNDIVFLPTFAHALRGRGDASGQAGEPLIVVGRQSRNYAVANAPLVIDPAARTVRTADIGLPADRWPNELAATPAGLLFTASTNGQRPLGLFQFSATDWQKQRLGDVPEGFLIAGDKGVEIFGQKWWRFDAESQIVSVVADSVPWYFDGRMSPEDGVSVTAEQRQTGLKLEHLGTSSHYGLLMQCVTGDSQWPLYQVRQRLKQ